MYSKINQLCVVDTLTLLLKVDLNKLYNYNNTHSFRLEIADNYNRLKLICVYNVIINSRKVGVLEVNNMSAEIGVHFKYNKSVLYSNQIYNVYANLYNYLTNDIAISRLDIAYDICYKNNLYNKVVKLTTNPNNFTLINGLPLNNNNYYVGGSNTMSFYCGGSTANKQLVIYNKSAEHVNRLNDYVIDKYLNQFNDSNNVWRLEVRLKRNELYNNKGVLNIELNKLNNSDYLYYVFNIYYNKILSIRKKDNNYNNHKNKCQKIKLINMPKPSNFSELEYLPVPKKLSKSQLTKMKNEYDNITIKYAQTLLLLRSKMKDNGIELDNIPLDRIIHEQQKLNDIINLNKKNNT